MPVSMKVADVSDIDSQGPHGRDPGRTGIQAACFGQLICKGGMKVRDHGFITRQLLVSVLVRVSQDGISTFAGRPQVRIKIEGHTLPRPGRRVVERINSLDPSIVVTFLGWMLANSQSELAAWALGRFLLIPDIPQVDLELTRKEKLMGWRKNGQ